MNELRRYIDRLLQERDWLSRSLYLDKHHPLKEKWDVRVGPDGKPKTASAWGRSRTRRRVDIFCPTYGGGVLEQLQDAALGAIIRAGIPIDRAAAYIERAEVAHRALIDDALECEGNSAHFANGEVYKEHGDAINSLCLLADAASRAADTLAATNGDERSFPIEWQKELLTRGEAVLLNALWDRKPKSYAALHNTVWKGKVVQDEAITKAIGRLNGKLMAVGYTIAISSGFAQLERLLDK